MTVLEFEKKMLLIGDASVGKTSLIRRFVLDKFDDRYIMTIGTKTTRKVMDLTVGPDKTRINLSLNIWDILGQTGMERAHQIYFKGAEAFLLVFDGTRRVTFDALHGWAEAVKDIAGSIPGVLACNKVDLKKWFAVTDEEVRDMAGKVGLTPLMTSAKTGENVEEAFRTIAEALCQPILKKYRPGATGSS